MFNSWIAYNKDELINLIIKSKAQNWCKSEVISKEQNEEIALAHPSNLYSPSVPLRIWYFIFTLFGGLTAAGPFGLLFSDIGGKGIRVLMIVLGVVMVIITDRLIIVKNHYKSGMVEAGIYAGFILILSGIFMFEPDTMYVYPLLSLVIATFVAIRYMNITALFFAVFFLGWLVFQVLHDLGGLFEALLPFELMALFGGLYLLIQKLKTRENVFFWEDQFILLDSLSLLIFYIVGNYFVVRELSIEMMDLHLKEDEDIPFAFLFYGLIVLIPILYLYIGFKSKSILFIRMSLIVTLITILTFRYYFSIGHPEITVTVGGALMLILGLVGMNYWKEDKHSFTRKLVLKDKWANPEGADFIVSQTMSTNSGDSNPVDEIGGGGSFGGGGASCKF
ncbi:MAG: hypothetical protein HRT72_05915 [Flavobacteriales bacterium]|nr:hypothetical protein [Flavobacteriales bacterium]